MFAWFRKDAQRFFRCYRARWLHKSLPIHSPIATRARKGGARDENVAHFSHTRELSPIIRKSFFPSSSFSPVTHTKAHRETDMASASPTQLNSLARRKVFFLVFGALNVTGPSHDDPMASRLLHDRTWRLSTSVTCSTFAYFSRTFRAGKSYAWRWRHPSSSTHSSCAMVCDPKWHHEIFLLYSD